MWAMLHEFFDKTYLINLDRRTDRLDRVRQRCEKVGISFERISAVDGTNLAREVAEAKSGIESCYWNIAALGLVLTFRNIIQDCITSNIKSVLILEDDVFFHDEINALVGQWMPLIPGDWETIYFGALHIEPFQPVNEYVGRMRKAYHTHCWALNHCVFEKCMEITSTLSDPLDVIVANEIHSRGKSYCFSSNLAYQEADHSDILNIFADVKM